MEQRQLKRVLGKGFSIAATIGTIIGLGIMRTPGEIARTVQDPALYMALWVGGGLFVLISTLVTAELISVTGRSGGPYTMIAHAFSPYPAFLLGWVDWVSNCAYAALKAVVLLEYLALLVPELRPHVTVGAALISTLFALLQLGGVRLGGVIQQTAAAGFALILACITAALFLGPSPAEAVAAAAGAKPPIIIGAGSSWAGYGFVAAAIVFTYDGWMAASYFGSEVKGGGRAAAMGAIRGVLIVIALYLAINLALVLTVPLKLLDGHELALSGALEHLYGPGSGSVLILAAIFILLAHQNIQYMFASRAIYALSIDDLGTRRATSVNQRGTPNGAVLMTWSLTILLILVGGFEFLLSTGVLLTIAMYAVILLGVLRLRRQQPDAVRPFRAWALHLTGPACVAGWVGIGLFIGAMDLKSSAYALLLAAVSVPAYLWLRSRRRLVSA